MRRHDRDTRLYLGGGLTMLGLCTLSDIVLKGAPWWALMLAGFPLSVLGALLTTWWAERVAR